MLRSNHSNFMERRGILVPLHRKAGGQPLFNHADLQHHRTAGHRRQPAEEPQPAGNRPVPCNPRGKCPPHCGAGGKPQRNLPALSNSRRRNLAGKSRNYQSIVSPGRADSYNSIPNENSGDETGERIRFPLGQPRHPEKSSAVAHLLQYLQLPGQPGRLPGQHCRRTRHPHSTRRQHRTHYGHHQHPGRGRIQQRSGPDRC